MAPTSGVGVGLCASRHRLLAVREKGKKIVNVVIKDDTCANYDGRARRMKIAAEETRPLQTGDTGRLLGAATLVFFFLLLQTALTESVVDSTQHPFTLSTFVVPPATTTIKSTSEVSPSQAVYVPDFPTTGNDLDAEVLQNSTEASTAGDSSAAETQPTTKRPAPVLYRHGKILEVPQAGQDTAAKKVLTPITIYKDRSPVVSFAKVPKVYLSTADESTETNRVEPSAIKVTTTFTFFSTTTDPLGRELISTSYSTQEGTLKVDDTQIMPTKRLRTDFTTFTYFSTTTHGLGDTEINSRTEVITRYVPTENVSARKKRDIQQKLETTLTDLVTTFNQGRLVISTRRQTLTRGTLHITNTVALPSVATVAPTAATEVVEDVHIRGHAPLDPRPVDHTYYTTYTYYTTTLNHGLPVTQTRYETVTQVQRINATLGLPAALDYRGSVLCQHCAVKNDLPWVVDGYEKIAPSTIYDHEHRDGGHHTAYSTLTFYTTHYPRGTSYVETHYSVVTNVATTTVTHYMPGLQGPVAPCANHHHTTFTYFTTRYSGPTATVDVQKETVTKCNEPPVVATRTVLAHAVAEASQPVTHDVHSVHSGVREDHQDHIHRPCTVCLPDYGLKTYYTTHTHFTTVLDKHGHPSVSTRYETYSDIFAGVRPTRTRYVRQATSEIAPQMRRLLSDAEQTSTEPVVVISMLKTGLITSFTQDRVTANVTTRFTTAISATYIRGFYAHIAQTYSNILSSTVILNTGTIATTAPVYPSTSASGTSAPVLQTSTPESSTPTKSISIETGLLVSTGSPTEDGSSKQNFTAGEASTDSVHAAAVFSDSPFSASLVVAGSSTSASLLMSFLSIPSLTHPTGVISSDIVDSVVSSGTTTVWRRNVIGTYINGFYAHVASTVTETVRPKATQMTFTSSKISLPAASSKETSSSTSTSTPSTLSTGLLSLKALATEMASGRTVVLFSAVYGTYIGGHYAQYAKIERSTITQTTARAVGFTTVSSGAVTQPSALNSRVSSAFTTKASTQSLQSASGPAVGLITSTTTRFTHNNWITVQTVYTIGTYIQGYYAHIAKTSSAAFPVTVEQNPSKSLTPSTQIVNSAWASTPAAVQMVIDPSQTLLNAGAATIDPSIEPSVPFATPVRSYQTSAEIPAQTGSFLQGSTAQGIVESIQAHQRTPSLSSDGISNILSPAGETTRSSGSSTTITASATSADDDDDDDDLKTGLLSRSTIVKNVSGVLYMFTYDVTGTFINGFYAHIARTQSSLLETSQAVSASKTEKVKRPIVTFHISEPNDHIENQLFFDELSQEIKNKLEKSLTLEDVEGRFELPKSARRTRPVFPKRRRQPVRQTSLPEPIESEASPPEEVAASADDDYDYDYGRSEEDQDQHIEPVRPQRLARAGSYNSRKNRLQSEADPKSNVRPTEANRSIKATRPALLARRRKTDSVQTAESSRRTETAEKSRTRTGTRTNRKRLQRQEDDGNYKDDLRQQTAEGEPKTRARQRGPSRRKINRSQQQRKGLGARQKGRRQQQQQQAALTQRQGRTQLQQPQYRRGIKFNPKTNRNSLPIGPQPTSTIRRASITLMSIVTTTKTLPIYHGFRTSFATITTTAVATSVVKPTEYSIIEETITATSVIDGEPSFVERHKTKTLVNRNTEINQDSTTITDIVISTTVFEQIRTVPILIGYRTRTDTVTELSTLTQLHTSVRTIFPEPTASIWNYAQTISPFQQTNPFLQANPFVANLGQNPGPNLFANAFYNQQQPRPRYLTSTIVAPATITTTSIIQVNLRGRKVLKTLTDTKITETTHFTTFAIQPTAAPLVGIGQLPLVTSQSVAPQFTTDITLVVTDQLGQARPVVTRVVLPIQHGKNQPNDGGYNISQRRQNYRKRYKTTPRKDAVDDAYDDEPLDEVLSPSETEILPSVTTILKSDQSKIYQQEASSHLKRLVRSAVDKPAPEDVYVGRKLLQFQQRQLEPSSSYYLPQFTNYNHAQYVSRILQSSIDNYFNPPQYDFQQYQPFQPYHNQYPYSDYPYDYHSQVPVPPQNDFHQQLAGFQQSFNPPAIEDPSSQQQAQPQAEPPLPHQPPLAPQQQEHQQQTLNVNHFPPLLSYDVDPPKDAKEVLVPNIQASRPSRFIVKSSKLKRKTILRKARPTPTFEFNPTTTEIDTASYVTPMRLRKSSVVRRRPQASEYPEVNPELARIPVLSPAPTPESTFVAQTPTLIRSSRVIPRQRLTSVVIQSSLPQYLFESAQVEELVTPEPKKKPKVKKLPDGTRRIVSSRVQPKLPVPLTSAPPVTFYTTFTYLTTFLHGTHTVYQSRESVVTSIHSGQVDPTLLSQISNGYVDGSTVPVITKTKGLATTIVNLQSRLHIAGDIAPASSIAPTPLIEATSVTPTFDLDQLDNVKKTVYVLQTFMYTVVDEAGVTHTSSKTEIKSNILATPTGLLKIQNTEEMSISNGYLALDNTRTVNLANDVRNGKTTKVDLSLRTVVKLDNVGDAIIRTQPASFEHTLASIEPSVTQTTTEYVQVTRPIVSSTDMTRKKIKIKSIVRKRPGVQTSILEPSQLESSFLFEITPALTEPTDSLTELISVTVSPTKQVKRLRVTVRKKASKLVRPVPESSSTFVDQTSATPPQISQPFQVVTKSNKTRLKASKIISRRVRPSDLIRQSPVISVTPVAFTTTTRLPIEVSGSTEYRDVELTTYSLVTSTITPSFFPSSPHLARPIQSSPVVLTYFTTTTYTIPITRDGATTYSTSEHTNSRIVTQYPEPSSLQPSLVLDAALVNELQTPRISDFETKTMFTTYTYYTTYFVNGSTSVISSLNVISNTLQVPLLSILPTPATPLTILKTSERLKVSTSYSTFTFYATLFNGTSSLVTPFEEVQSQVFTLTESFVVTRTVSIAPTAGAALPSDILQSVLPDQPPQEPVRSTQTSSVPSFTLFTLAPGSTSSSRSGPLVPSVKTFLTTFTYFTTFFRQSSSYVVSKESVVTSYATLFVDQAKLKPTTTKRPVSTTTKLDPRVPYTTYTSYTTYTFYTTLFGGKDKIVISSEQIVPQVVTMRLDGSTTKITPTTTQYSTYTAPPVTDDLVPSTETQEVRKPLVTVTSMSSPSASFFSPSSTTTTSTYEVVSRPTETTMTALSETSTVTSSTTERAVETTTTLFTIPTVALPEIIIRDDKPTVSLTKKSSTVTSTAPLTTLPHTQTLILSSSTRFFGRDRRLTHIGSGSILFLITGQDGLLTRSQGLTATASATIATTAIEPTATTTTTTTTATTTTATTTTATTTTTAATTTTTTTVGATQIAPSNTQPGTILDLTDILGGKGGKLGEAIKGIVNLFNTKNTTTNPDAATSQISRKDSSLPAGPVMVSSQEPVFIPLSPVLDISSFIKPAATSASIAPTSVHSKLTPIYKPDETKEGKGLHISREKLMSDISKAMTKATSAQTSTVASKSIIPSKTTGFETTPLESVSVIVGAETIFFDEGTSTELADSTREATEVSTSTTGIHPTFVQTVGSAPATVSPSPEVSVEISHESSVAPKYEVQAQSSIVVQPTASSSPVESIVSESSIRPSRPTIYFQVSSTATTPGPKPVSEVDYGGVKVFIAGRGSRKPVEPVIKPENPQTTRKPLPNIFKVGTRKGPGTTTKPPYTGPKVKISFPKPPPAASDIGQTSDDFNDIFSAFQPFNSTIKEQPDGPTPTPLCYPSCDSSRHETCAPNPSKSARNKYICVCRPGYTRDPDGTSNRCIASQTFLLPVHLIRASSKGSAHSQMPRLLHALKVSLEQMYSDHLGFPKGSLLDAKINSVQKVTNYQNESSLALTLVLSQRASNADISLPLLSEQLTRSASALNASLVSLQSPFLLLASAPIEALQDLDECTFADLNDCSYYARCINVPGSFHCECKSGYQDLDVDSPGRTCSSEIKNCQFCSARGSCILGIDNGIEKTTCRCNTMYLGRRCEINGLVLAIALPIALSLLTVTVCCSVKRCRPRYRSATVKPPLPPTKIAMAYPGGGSLLASSDKGHSDKTQMISDSSSEGETSQGGDPHGWHGHGHHPHSHHGPIDGRHTQMSSGGYSGYGDSLAETLSAHPLPSIVIPRVRPKLPARQR
ncbi:uncharacterized protein LOC111253556 isoform X4 [Varroa destructor]|uniref:EGF-like domain-containing protein n=1 Tax=Varroa destructor TaxID=109461 RepID=A0A7M7KU40_VARDE|nr:uncharacterized protein LOC111253556 isoform X4 [Varroa destructor]